MHLLALAPQDEQIIQAVERGWHNGIILFLQNKLPKIAIVLLVVFILHRIALFFVKKMRAHADIQAHNFHRAAQ
ncbi:MAG: mechanosensitive ion channel family protein, partial [Edaphobacter sp.]